LAALARSTKEHVRGPVGGTMGPVPASSDLGLADPPHGKKDRHSRKKFEKFVNGHDARDGKWDRDRDWERERERDRFRFSNRFDRNRWDDNDEIGRYRQSLRRSLRFGSFDLFRNLR